MSPINLLPLTKTRLASAEFYTSYDDDIEVEILRILPINQSIIIRTDKVIDTDIIYTTIYIDNRAIELKFHLIEELNVGQEYIAKMMKPEIKKKLSGVVNTYGSIEITSPIPSLSISNNTCIDDVTMSYRTIVLGESFLVCEIRNLANVTNLQDCLLEGKPFEISSRQFRLTSVKKLSPTCVKVEFNGKLNILSMNKDFNENINDALNDEVNFNYQLIKEAYEENN